MDKRTFGLVLISAALVGAVLVFAPQTSSVIRQDNGAVAFPPIALPPREATMLFVGDIMLSRAVGDLMVRQNDWRWPFRRIASVIAEADLAFGNLETTISPRGRPQGCRYCFRADPNVIIGLTYAGFDVLSVANNHVWDYGRAAFEDTLAYVSNAHIDVVGGGMNADTASSPVFRSVGDARVAFLAYTNLLPVSAGAGPSEPGANLYEATRMNQDIADAKKRADLIVVSFHAGQEYTLEPVSWQRQMYESAVQAGADLVVGHHPHVIQPIERYQDGWIAYSLGNFIFDQTFSDETMRGIMLQVELRGSRIVGVHGMPVTISRQYQPRISTSGE